MKILIVSIYAECLDLAIHLQEEGHTVAWYITKKEDKDIGKGIVKVISGWKNYVKDADLIIFPDVVFGNLPMKIREEMGKSVLGGSSYSDKLENDREFADTIWEKLELKTPKTYKFDNWTKVKIFIKKSGRRWVFKPQGQKPRIFTYVSESPEDMIGVIEHFEKIWQGKPEFVLQQYIEGVEIAVGGFFNGINFVRPVNINFEHKRIGVGDRGPNTGEMGTVLKHVNSHKLFGDTLSKLAPFLKFTNYRGYVDLNCMVTKNGPYILEATIRPGFPTMLIQDGAMKEPWGDFLKRLADGKAERVKVIDKWITGIGMVSLPWPVEMITKKYADYPIQLDWQLVEKKKLHLSDVKLIKEGKSPVYATAGSTGYILVGTGEGDSIKESQEKANKVLETVRFSQGYWRPDIGERVIRDMSKLREWGYGL